MEAEDKPRETRPVARSLAELVRALHIVESELGFQVHRLNEHVKPRTASEIEYHENLKEGYQTAQRWVGILRRYHQGRLDRAGAEVGSVSESQGDDPSE